MSTPSMFHYRYCFLFLFPKPPRKVCSFCLTECCDIFVFLSNQLFVLQFLCPFLTCIYQIVSYHSYTLVHNHLHQSKVKSIEIVDVWGIWGGSISYIYIYTHMIVLVLLEAQKGCRPTHPTAAHCASRARAALHRRTTPARGAWRQTCRRCTTQCGWMWVSGDCGSGGALSWRRGVWKLRQAVGRDVVKRRRKAQVSRRRFQRRKIPEDSE